MVPRRTWRAPPLGACAGAGLGWACACDFRYAAASARFNVAFLDVGVAGDMGGPWTLALPLRSGLRVAGMLLLAPWKGPADRNSLDAVAASA